MDRASASGRHQKPASGRRVRINSGDSSPGTPNTLILIVINRRLHSISGDFSERFTVRKSQGSDAEIQTRRGNALPVHLPSHRRQKRRNPPSTPNSLKSLDEATSLSDNQVINFTSSSSYDLFAEADSTGKRSKMTDGKKTCRERSVGMEQVATGSEQAENLVDIVVIDSEEDEEEIRDNSRQTSKHEVERTRFPLKEVASEAIREMQEFDRKRKGKSIENPEGPALEMKGLAAEACIKLIT